MRTLRLFQRGEAVVASAGLGVAVVLLSAMGASAWWMLSTQQRTLASSRIDQFNTVGTMLGKAVEGMVAAGDLAGLVRVLDNAARTYGLEKCEVRLPDGTVVARAGIGGAAGHAAHELPERWSDAAAPADAGNMKVEQGPERGIQVTSPLWVARRGPVILELIDRDGLGSSLAGTWSASDQWRLQAGVGVIGAVSLSLMLLVYRHMRARLRGLGAIGEALVAAGQTTGNEADAAAQPEGVGAEMLRVSERLGPEAAAWNRLLEERERLRERAMAERITDELSNRKGADSDVVSACDALWQGVVVVDERMQTKYANGAAGVFFSTKRDDMIGKDIAQFLTDAKALDSVRAVVTGKSKQRVVIEIGQANESQPASDKPSSQTAQQAGPSGVLRLSVRPIRREDQGRALIVIEDVTQQRVADQARNSFVAQATHELRTPLTNMRLYIDSLIEDGDEDPVKRASALNVISQEARRLERIVGDMLSVSEIEAGQLRIQEGDVRLDQMFSEVEADFREQAQQKDIRLAFDLPPKMPVIRGDRDKIVIAVHNLVGNAIKYTPAGGEVSVRVVDAASGAAGPGEVSVHVKDNGIGIKPEEQEKIFDKFYRAKDKRITGITGTGLGLALAREIARLHGGDITIESQIDRGSTFTLHLPAVPRASDAGPLSGGQPAPAEASAQTRRMAA